MRCVHSGIPTSLLEVAEERPPSWYEKSPSDCFCLVKGFVRDNDLSSPLYWCFLAVTSIPVCQGCECSSLAYWHSTKSVFCQDFQPGGPYVFEPILCRETEDADIYIWTIGDQVEVPSGDVVTREDW